MKKLKELKDWYFRKKWILGFVEGGLDAVMSDKPLRVKWVRSPYKDRWFADPFILDVADDKYTVLAEELRYGCKGRIAKLTIDRRSMRIVKMSIVLELGTHLSFPNILRKDGRTYVYPENCTGGRQNIYEYDEQSDRLVEKAAICMDRIWDSSITTLFGKPRLFAGNRDNYHLDIYDWNEEKRLFEQTASAVSKKQDNRLAGQLFEYGGSVYCPFQDCSQTYGGAVVIKRVALVGDGWHLEPVVRHTSPHPSINLGLHTLNEYKGAVIVDARGFVRPSARWVYKLKKHNH